MSTEELNRLIETQHEDRHRVRVGHDFALSLEAFPNELAGDPWADPVADAVLGLDDEQIRLAVDLSKRRWRWADPKPAQPAAHAERDRCPAGHPYDEENTLWVASPRNPSKRWRQCRKCRAARRVTTKARETNKAYQRARRQQRRDGLT